MLTVRNCCYVAVCSAARGASAPKGEERGGGIPRRPPVYSLLLLLLLLLHCAIAAAQCIVIGPVCLWVGDRARLGRPGSNEPSEQSNRKNHLQCDIIDMRQFILLKWLHFVTAIYVITALASKIKIGP